RWVCVNGAAALLLMGCLSLLAAALEVLEEWLARDGGVMMFSFDSRRYDGKGYHVQVNCSFRDRRSWPAAKAVPAGCGSTSTMPTSNAPGARAGVRARRSNWKSCWNATVC